MKQLSCDVLVVGSGAAGLRAAIAAKEKGADVMVVSKGGTGKGTCTILSGGAFAGAPDEKSLAVHRDRTLQTGRGLNHPELVDLLVEEGPARLQELLAWGLKGTRHRGNLYTESQPPLRGRAIIDCLAGKTSALNVRFLSGYLVIDLKLRKGAAGVRAISRDTGEILDICGRAVILATGGAGALYRRHDNPNRMVGDGYCLALKAGAVLQDMEFVQFYPLGLAEPGLPAFLIPPVLADAGRLYNDRHEDIYQKYEITERPAGIRARDRLSQAFFTEIERNGNAVWLDVRGVSDDDWQSDPFSASTCRLFGERYGAKNRPVRIAPLAHHVMGGVRADARGATSVPGLFAAGEITGGLHGANRMGGNALTETVVFGARAGEAAAAWAADISDDDRNAVLKDLDSPVFKTGAKGDGAGAAELMAGLQKILWEEGGIMRNRPGLRHALAATALIGSAADELPAAADPRRVQRFLDLRVASRVAALILQGALRREESRGAHFREDFPEQNDATWRGHLQVRLSEDGKELWNFQKV